MRRSWFRPLVSGGGAIRLAILVQGLLVALSWNGGSLGAQVPADEARMLRDAAALESTGDFEAAEDLLKAVLRANPTSSGALFALERTLRAQGRVEEILDHADRFLAADPSATGPRYLKLRVLVEVGDLEGVEREGERWLAQDPLDSQPYREVARVLGQARGPEAGLAVLLEGLSRASGAEELYLDLGDVHLELGQYAEAGVAWARGVGPTGERGGSVLRRVNRLQAHRAEVVTPLVEELGARDRTSGQRKVAAHAAVEAGLNRTALELSRDLVRDLDVPSRRAFLSELARQSEERRADEVSLWAYRALRETSTVESEGRALDRRIGEVALQVGDTAVALDSWRDAVEGLEQGSPERRRTLAQVLRIQATLPDSDPAVLREDVMAYGEEFPEAPELDGLSAAVARRLLADGDPAAAGAVVEGVMGPQSALERAYLLLAGEDPGAAQEDLLRALDGLPARQATDVIALADLLERGSEPTRRLAARATLLAHQGDPEAALDSLALGVGRLPESDQAMALALAGRLAWSAGFPSRAERAWTALRSGHPEAPEAPEATLSLALSRARDPAGRDDAVTLLEELILSRPDSPIVPIARREMERLKSGGVEP